MKWNDQRRWKGMEMTKIWRNEGALVKIERLGLKWLANCIEEGEILKRDFDHQDELRFWFQSQKWIQNIKIKKDRSKFHIKDIKGYIDAIIRFPLMKIGIEEMWSWYDRYEIEDMIKKKWERGLQLVDESMKDERRSLSECKMQN